MIKLLLVDDEAIIRDGMAHMMPLKELDIRITASCSNAFSALDCMTDDMPDILMTDIKMPGMDGLALIERALTLNPELQCVILSGFDEFEFARRALKMGVREYLLKPCSRNELADTLGRVCNTILEQRRRVLGGYDTHQRRMTELEERLEELLLKDEITESMVSGALNTDNDMSLARDAIIYMVTHRGGIPPEWAMRAIQGTYAPGEEICSSITNTLIQIHNMSLNESNYIEKMKSYLQTHYGEPGLSLQYLADEVVHMNADYIGKEFAKATGSKVSAYLMRIRMEHAKELLAMVREPIIYEIAEQVGLGHNPQYFSQLFRKYTGLTPKEYSMANSAG